MPDHFMLFEAMLLIAGFSAIGALITVVSGRLRDRLCAAERLAVSRARTLALAAEELRGPGLVLMAQSARARYGTGHPGQACQVEAIAQHLLRLADDLSDSAVEPSPRALHETSAPLSAVVDAAIANVSAQLRPGLRHWKVDPGLRAIHVWADGRALEGALIALLRRAARHSRDGDVVSLRHMVGPNTFAIVVEDEGDGLLAHDLASEAASHSQDLRIGLPNGTRGLDLGLNLARSLALAHGGDIRLESAPGIGARAWLTLPRGRLLKAT